MTQTIKEHIDKHCRQRKRPDGSNYLSLTHKDEQLIARLTGLTLKQVQISALERGIIPERYSRNQKSLNNEDQIKLLNSHVAVIGQGGLGGTVTEILARIGVGTLTLVDGDVFEESNLNRQLLSTIDSLNQKKADCGKARVLAINPAIEVHSVCEFLSRENSHAILTGCDLAVDCLDSIPARFALEAGCRHHNIALVSAAIGGATGQITVIFPEDSGLRILYGSPEKAPQKGIETQLGTLPYAATFMAALECAEAVSLLCRNIAALHNTILIANVDEKSMEKIILPSP